MTRSVASLATKSRARVTVRQDVLVRLRLDVPAQQTIRALQTFPSSNQIRIRLELIDSYILFLNILNYRSH